MWFKPLFLTLELMAVTVAIAGTVGVCGAWAATTLQNAGRLGRWLAQGFLIAMVTAIAIPMVLHAAAWEATAGKFGWLVLTQTGSRDYQGLVGRFGGLIASGWIHGLFSTSIVALATWYGVRRVPDAIVEQSRLEMGEVQSWWRVRLPIALPWLLMGLMATAALAATEMTVVDLYQFRTLADEFYLSFVEDPDATAIMMTLVIPVIIGCGMVGLHFKARPQMVSVRAAPTTTVSESPSRRTFLACAFIVVAISLFVVAIPLTGLVVKVGHQVTIVDGQRAVTWSFGRCASMLASAPRTFAAEYKWTMLLALLTSVCAVGFAWPLSALGRSSPRLEPALDVLMVALFLIPGPIVGLTIVRLFQLPVPGFWDLYQASLVPTILALLFRSLPVAYWILRAGYRGIDSDLISAASMDVSWWHRMWSIDRPLLKGSLIAGLLASAILASGDVPATLPVVPPRVSTVGTRLFGLLHSGARYQEAALAIWYVGAIVTIVLAGLRWNRVSRARM